MLSCTFSFMFLFICSLDATQPYGIWTVLHLTYNKHEILNNFN